MPFSDSQLAYLHMTLAICAHNRQFSTVIGNDKINHFIQYHNEKALEYNKNNPLRTAIIQYRLAVVNARRAKKVIQGLKWANLSIEPL